MSRRAKLEGMLKASPGDVFLAYALALEMLKEGDHESGCAQLRRVMTDHPDYQAAYFQLGQTLASAGETEDAKSVIRSGIEAARRSGDAHAAEEMAGFLATLG